MLHRGLITGYPAVAAGILESALTTRGLLTDIPDYAGAMETGRWRKLKGIARVRLIDGTIHTGEIHWYEAHGVGRRELKIKFPLLD